MTSRLVPCLIALLLLALAVLFFAHLTLGGEVLFWGMPMWQFYPWRTFAAAEWLAGRVPLWNPYAGFGMPLAANLQSGVFYPLNLHYLLLPVHYAQTITLVGHIAIAGGAMYGLLRALAAGRLAALVAGVAYMFSGFVVAQGSFHNTTCVLAWAPAALWGVEAAATATTGRDRLRALAGLAVATALLLLGGFIQYAVYALLAAAGWALVRLELWGALGTLAAAGRSVRVGLTVAGGVLLGVLLAGVQLLPTAELTRESVRHAGLGFDDATSASLWPGMLLTTVAPGLFGGQATNDWRVAGTPYEGVLFLGALPLLAAVAGVRARHPLRWYLVLLAGAGLFLALGRYNPLYQSLFNTVPGLATFHAPARYALWYVLAVCVLAGLGVDALAKAPPTPAFRRLTDQGDPLPAQPPSPAVRALRLTAGGGLALAGVGGALLVAGAGTPFLARAGAALAEGGGWLVVAAGLLLLRARVPSPVWAAGLVACTVLNLASAGRGLVPGTDAALYDPQLDAPALARLRDQAGFDRTWVDDAGYLAAQGRYFNLSGFWVTDLPQLQQARRQLIPNLGNVAGLYEVHNYDPLRLGRGALLETAAPPDAFLERLLDLMGVRYLPAGSQVRSANSRVWGALGDQPVRERAGRPLPRAFVTAAAVSVDGPEAALARLREPGFDPATTAVVEGAVTIPLPGGPGSFTLARITEYEHQRLTVSVDSPGGVLVVTDAYYPGWRAYLDGAETPIYPTDVAFRGVRLPPGPHLVEMRYQPATFSVGLALSGVGAVLLCLVLLAARAPRRTA